MVLAALVGWPAMVMAQNEEIDIQATRELAESLDTSPLEGFVLVWSDAPLFTSESEARAASSNIDVHRARSVAFRLLDDHGGVVQIASIDPAEPHCLNQSFTDIHRDFRLEFWVRRDHLAPVLSTSATLGFADGTFIRLQPGLLVVQTREGVLHPVTPHVAIGIGGVDWLADYEVPFEVGAELVELSYQPDEPLHWFERIVPEGTSRLIDAQLGGSPVALPRELSYQLVTDAPDPATEQPTGRFDVIRNCVQMRVDAEQIAELATGSPLPAIGRLCGSTGTIRAGATVYSETGIQIGRTTTAVDLCGRASREVGEQLCVEWPLSSSSTGWLCHQHADVNPPLSFGGGLELPNLGMTDELASLTGLQLSGLCDRDAVATVILRHQPAVRDCWLAGADETGTSAGEVLVSFWISEDGSTANPAFLTTEVPELEHCVFEVIEAMRFPEPSAGVVRVRYPFRFDR